MREYYYNELWLQYAFFPTAYRAVNWKTFDPILNLVDIDEEKAYDFFGPNDGVSAYSEYDVCWAFYLYRSFYEDSYYDD